MPRSVTFENSTASTMHPTSKCNEMHYCWGIWEFASALVSLFTCRERAQKRGYPR